MSRDEETVFVVRAGPPYGDGAAKAVCSSRTRANAVEDSLEESGENRGWTTIEQVPFDPDTEDQ